MAYRNKIAIGLASMALPFMMIAASTQPGVAQTQADRLEALLRGQAAKIEELNKELQALKRQQNATATRVASKGPITKGGPVSDDVPYVKKGSKRLTWNLPGSDVNLRIGGYAKLDAIARVGGKGGVGSEDNFAPTGIFTRRGVGQTAATDAASNIHARQTRFFVEASKDNTPFGPAKAVIEGDFFGAGGNQVVSNSTTFRLRHAYGQIGGLLAGQFWTTFSDPSTYAETLDFGGPGSQSFIRQAQIRYIHNFGGGLTIGGAVENPEGRARIATPNAAGVTPIVQNGVFTTKDTSPDFIGRVRYEGSWGHVQVSGLTSRTNTPLLSANPTATTVARPGQGQYGYAALFSAKVKLPFIHEKDSVYGQAGYTDGASRYIQDVATQQSVTYNGATGVGVTLKSYGFFIGYEHWWTNTLRSTGTYGFLRIDSPAFSSVAQLRNTEYAAGNIIWSPWNEVDIGAEVQWGERIDRDGRKGTQTRIQSSLVYRF